MLKITFCNVLHVTNVMQKSKIDRLIYQYSLLLLIYYFCFQIDSLSTSLDRMSSASRSLSSSNRYNREKFVLTNSGRARYPPTRSSHSTGNSKTHKSRPDPVNLHNLLKLNQLVNTLKSLKRLISHYFDQVSKQGESVLAGDVRRVYRRILLLYVKYRRRQNYEKRCLKQPIDESDGEDNNNNQTDNVSTSTNWTLKKIVSPKNLPFTRAGFDANHDSIEDFDEIALAATRDVANIQNHCVRLILNDRQMKLPIYSLRTRWDSEIPKQRKETESSLAPTVNTPVEVVRKTGIKSSTVLPIATSLPSSPTLSVTTPTTTDQELFLGSFARQLSEQTWEQLRTILANFNSQTSSLSSSSTTRTTIPTGIDS